MIKKSFAFFLCRRLLEALGTLLGLVVLSFFLLRALPGGPFDEEATLHPLVREKLVESWKLDESAMSQLIGYFQSILQGDFGWSISHPGRSVKDLVMEAWENTMSLNLVAIFMVLSLGGLFSFAGYLWREKKQSQLLEIFLLAMISLPGLLLGPLLLWAFSFELNWFPAAFLSSPWHFVLPVLTLSIRPAASLSRILIGTYQNLRREDYLRTAQAKGLLPTEIFWKHVLKNAIGPALNYSGPMLVGIFSGSFLVEVLFSIRGLGALFVQSVMERDFTVVLGLTLFYGALLVAASFVIDLIQRQLDPRLKEAR